MTVQPDTITMTKADYRAMLAAYWLMGVAGGFRQRGFPKWLKRKEFFQHETTAQEIARGGTYRGPLVVYELIDYVQQLSKKVTPPLLLRD